MSTRSLRDLTKFGSDHLTGVLGLVKVQMDFLLSQFRDAFAVCLQSKLRTASHANISFSYPYYPWFWRRLVPLPFSRKSLESLLASQWNSIELGATPTTFSIQILEGQ